MIAASSLRAVDWSHGRARAIVHGLALAGFLFNVQLILFWLPNLDLFIDARAWERLDLGNLYGPGEVSLAVIGAFRYSPAAAWLIAPMSLLPWPLLVATLVALDVAAVVILARAHAIALLLAFPPILLELLNGNIAILMALAVWVGMRWPAAWAFVLLTKVTPGVGLLWFVARREWRSLAIALGVTGGIVAAGWVVAPGLWAEWIRSLVIALEAPATTGVPPLVARLPVAAAIALFAGMTGRAWLIPVAAYVGSPILWLHGTAILTACFPLWWERARWQQATNERAGPNEPADSLPEASPA